MAQKVIGDYQTFYVVPNFKVVVTAAPDFHLSDSELQAVEAAWHTENRAKQSALFNGQILACSSYDQSCLQGYFIDYKLYVALIHLPQLKAKLNIQVIGVSGITRSGRSILMGKRGSTVTKYAGFYECVPSGGLNNDKVIHGEIPLRFPFEQELWEEAHIQPALIETIQVSCLVSNPAEHLLEIIGLIDVNPTLCQQPLEVSDEYEVLTWVKQEDLNAFFAQHSHEILSFSQYILTTVGLNS